MKKDMEIVQLYNIFAGKTDKNIVSGKLKMEN